MSTPSPAVRPVLLVGALALAGASSLVGPGCQQPPLYCASAHGAFAASYTLIDGDPDSPCGALAGDVLGVSTYVQPRGGPGSPPDYGDASLAIRPQRLGELLAYAEARGAVDGDAVHGDANAVGPFTSAHPGDDELCMVPELEPAHVSLPTIPAIADDPATPDLDEAQPEQPAVDLRYRWRDVRILVTADAQGTQLEAELELEQGGCVARYRVLGLYPAVGCESDADCLDEANGINPDFAVRCAPELALCVLAEPPPAYE